MGFVRFVGGEEKKKKRPGCDLFLPVTTIESSDLGHTTTTTTTLLLALKTSQQEKVVANSLVNNV